MGKMGLSANVNTFLRFMGLNFSEDSIEKLEDIVASFPKDRLDELSVQLWKKVDKEGLTEEEAIRIMNEIVEKSGVGR